MTAPAMFYELGRMVLSSRGYLRIDEAEYNALEGHADALIQGVDIEEKFDLLIANYRELESEFLTITTHDMIYRDLLLRDDDNDVKTTVNRRVFNLLSACRLYTDHIQHHVRELFGKSSAEDRAAKAFKSDQYDKSFAYRFAEALRNYVQHRGYPVDHIVLGSNWIGSEPDRRARFSLEVGIHIEDIADEKFNARALEEAAARTPKNRDGKQILDLKAVLREYVECLCNVHASLRALVKNRLDRAEAQIEAAAQRFAEANPGEDRPKLGLAILQVDEDHILVGEHRYLPYRLIALRAFYNQRNAIHMNLSKRYVTGE